MNPSFFVVWCPSNGPPRVRHATQEAAEKEASRLARMHPGTEFIVLEAVSAAIKDDVRVTQFDSVSIPF